MYKLIDVKGDGSCFYRSLYVVLKGRKLQHRFLKSICEKGYTKTFTEDDFVNHARQGISNLIQEQKDYGELHSIFKHLSELDKVDYKEILNSSFPTWFTTTFNKLPKSESSFRKKFAAGITSMDHWASEIDIRIISNLLKKELHLDLIIFNNIPSAKQQFKPNAIYLLNRSEFHYNAIIPKPAITNSNAKTQLSNIHKQSTKQKTKECPSTHILNPKTSRCVKKSSCKGYEVLLNYFTSQKRLKDS